VEAKIAIEVAVFAGAAESDRKLRRSAGSATGNSWSPQLRSARTLLPARSVIETADSWHVDFSAALRRSHACALHNAPQTGVTSSNDASTQIDTVLVHAIIGVQKAIKSGYASEVTASTQGEILVVSTRYVRSN